MGFIKDSVLKQKRFVEIVSQKEHISKGALWLNWLWCFFRYGATPSDWYCYEIYKYRHLYLRKIITRRKNIELDKLFNPQEYKEIFDNKYRFNQCYSDFVKRQWFLYPHTPISEIRSRMGGGKS